MIKKLISMILLILTLNTLGQNKIGINIQPEISFANWEQYWFTYSYGVTSDIKVYKQLSLVAGLGYKSKLFDVGWLSYLLDNYPVDSYLLRSIPVHVKLKYNFIPQETKFKIYAISGVTIDFSLYQKFNYPLSGDQTSISRSFNYYDAHLGIGLGVEYEIKRVSIFSEPSFNIAFARNCNFYHPYANTFSVNFGVMYKFQKKN